MAKAASPIRLQKDLMDDAALTGKRYHRSASEQIEYWASIGRGISDVIDPDTLLSVAAGLARVQIEPVYGQAVNPEQVFKKLERERKQGTLSNEVTGSSIKYQASSDYPGYLERIDENNGMTIGQFKDGKFIRRAKSA
jgi:ParD-like antitoxin of type II ParDE toxin-antitoxin system